MSNLRTQAIELAKQHPTADRKTLLGLFVSELKMSKNTASTYASEVRKYLEETADIRANIEARENESEEEIAYRLQERFDVLSMLSFAACQSRIRSLIISGPAGLGKSFTVERTLKHYDPEQKKTSVVKGYVRASGLFKLLFQHRHPGCVVVLDDADSIFADENALNILKAACDSTEERMLHWGAETIFETEDGEKVDRNFLFEGSVVFITNKDFDTEIAKGNRGCEHFEALISRSHYVDCDMKTTRDYIVRIKQVVAQGMLRNGRGLDQFGEDTIVSFIEEHADDLRELTLRMALKLADIYTMDPAKFEKIARVSCFKSGR